MLLDTLVSQPAASLAVVGLLGLALGWWLGRWSNAKPSARAVEKADRRLEALEEEFEAASLEVGRLADQLAQSKIEVEEAREGTRRAASELESTREQFETGSERLASFEARLSEKEEALDGLRTDRETLRGRVAELEDAERQAQGRIAALTRRLASAQARASEFQADAQRAEQQLEALGATEAEPTGHDSASEAARGGDSPLAGELERLRADLRSSTRRVEELESRLASVEAARLSAETQREKAERELEALLSTPLIDVDRMATVKPVRFDVEDEGVSPPAGRPELLEVPRDAGDDLRRIRGIDDSLAETLNSLGVHHFHQIAAWSESDIQWVAAHLDASPDRILRDRWREQAVRLAEEGSEPQT